MPPQNVETGEGYGAVSEEPKTFLNSWKSPIAAVLAIVLFGCGIATLFSTEPKCIGGGILQMICASLIVACEAPLFLSFMTCVAPLARFWDEKPVWIKTVSYVVIAVLSVCTGCVGVFYILGFLSSLGIAIIYGLVLIGPKAVG